MSDGNGLGVIGSARHSFGVSPAIGYRYASMEEAFPNVDPGLEPFGSAVLLQVRQPMNKTAGGVHLPDESRESDHYNTQVCLVRAIGPLAFKNRNDGKLWPEGAWCQVGDFVRVPKYQGDRFFVEFQHKTKLESGDTQTTSDQCVFVVFKDLQILGKITANPLAVKSFY